MSSHELIVEYGGEMLTLRQIADQTGVRIGRIWDFYIGEKLTVPVVMEYLRRKRCRALARENGLTAKQAARRRAQGMSWVDAATRPRRKYEKRSDKWRVGT